MIFNIIHQSEYAGWSDPGYTAGCGDLKIFPSKFLIYVQVFSTKITVDINSVRRADLLNEGEWMIVFRSLQISIQSISWK